jgi:hypothetical protein
VGREEGRAAVERAEGWEGEGGQAGLVAVETAAGREVDWVQDSAAGCFAGLLAAWVAGVRGVVGMAAVAAARAWRGS